MTPRELQSNALLITLLFSGITVLNVVITLQFAKLVAYVTLLGYQFQQHSRTRHTQRAGGEGLAQGIFHHN